MTALPPWLDEVLSYDDLAPEERTTVDETLREHASARALLATVRQIEANPGPLGELPEGVDGAPDTEAAASLKRLEERVRFEAMGRADDRRATRRISAPFHYLLPAAAAALLLLTLGSPIQDSPPGPVSRVEVRHTELVRGSAPESEWRTGDGFVLQIQLERPAFVVLVHVDPQGKLSILDPEDGVGPARQHDAGSVQFPSADDEWFLDGNPGTETLLVASTDVSSGPAPESARWSGKLLAPASERRSREDVVADAMRILRNHFRAVERTDLQHAAREDR
ncbi:MAG: hypothetical protein DHS20C21_23400 [Gemmatimonadota bacterium]|nr:MAG: hypothetical protein DHS20C21_23400 [Gemmatimonadota bacterium]